MLTVPAAGAAAGPARKVSSAEACWGRRNPPFPAPQRSRAWPGGRHGNWASATAPRSCRPGGPSTVSPPAGRAIGPQSTWPPPGNSAGRSTAARFGWQPACRSPTPPTRAAARCSRAGASSRMFRQALTARQNDETVTFFEQRGVRFGARRRGPRQTREGPIGDNGDLAAARDQRFDRQPDLLATPRALALARSALATPDRFRPCNHRCSRSSTAAAGTQRDAGNPANPCPAARQTPTVFFTGDKQRPAGLNRRRVCADDFDHGHFRRQSLGQVGRGQRLGRRLHARDSCQGLFE